MWCVRVPLDFKIHKKNLFIFDIFLGTYIFQFLNFKSISEIMSRCVSMKCSEISFLIAKAILSLSLDSSEVNNRKSSYKFDSKRLLIPLSIYTLLFF